jgi:hypothetical protein
MHVGWTVPEPLTLPLVGTLDPARESLPLPLTVAIALPDSFNPYAFFMLLFLLSLLVHQHDRRRMRLVGQIFVATSGLMYFAFMAVWLHLFTVLGGLPWITALAGAVALTIGLISIKGFVPFTHLLKLLSGCLMSGLSALLLIAPEQLARLGVSTLLVAAALTVTAIAARRSRPK